MSALEFADVSLTSGQQAVWGGAATAAMLAAPVRALARTGVAALEVVNAGVIAGCVARGEHPLGWLDTARRNAHGTRLRAAVNVLPDHMGCDVLEGEFLSSYLGLLRKHGIDEVLLIDPLLDFPRLRHAFAAAAGLGMVSTAALPFVGDERSDREYATLAREMTAAGAQRLMLRDESGLLDCDRLKPLIQTLKEALVDIPVDLHVCCQTGLGPQVALEAARLGIARLDTAVPTLANGASVPSLELVARRVSEAQRKVARVDLHAVREADAALVALGESEGFSKAQPWAFDLAPYIHRLPADVAAEAMEALGTSARWHQLIEFSRECELIRKEMGSPPMLQPFAKAISRQALDHLRRGRRYEELQPQLRRVLGGIYPQLIPMRADLRERIGNALSVRRPSVATEDDLILAQISGRRVLPSRLRADLCHELLAPEEILLRGLLSRRPAFASLQVSGPGIFIQLEQ